MKVKVEAQDIEAEAQLLGLGVARVHGGRVLIFKHGAPTLDLRKEKGKEEWKILVGGRPIARVVEPIELMNLLAVYRYFW